MPLTLSPFDPLDALAIASPEQISPAAIDTDNLIAWTLHDDFGPIAAAGFRRMSSTEAYAWALLGEEIKRRPFTLHRLVKRNLIPFAKNAGIATVFSDIIMPPDKKMKWMFHLGFTPVETLPNAYGLGHDHLLCRLDLTDDERIRRGSSPPGDRLAGRFGDFLGAGAATGRGVSGG